MRLSSMKCIYGDWCLVPAKFQADKLQLVRLGQQQPKCSFMIEVFEDLKWSLQLPSEKLSPGTSLVLQHLPECITTVLDLRSILTFLDQCTICQGNPDPCQTWLGLKKLTFDGDGDAQHIHDTITTAYPVLIACGGYTLMRLAENSQELVSIDSPDGGMTIPFLKDIPRQAKLYVRPLQMDITVKEAKKLCTMSEMVP